MGPQEDPMSDAALKRIEKAIEKLAEQQNALCTAIGEIQTQIGAPKASRDEVISFLDRFRAIEALGEASLGAWIEVSTTPCLKGGLRTVQMREGMHARLLEQRIKALGGSPEYEVPDAVHDAVMSGAASTDKSDAEKVKEFVAQFPDIDKALKPIYDIADKLDDDQETQSLLRTIVQDERSTLEFLNEACALLNPS